MAMIVLTVKEEIEAERGEVSWPASSKETDLKSNFTWLQNLFMAFYHCTPIQTQIQIQKSQVRKSFLFPTKVQKKDNFFQSNSYRLLTVSLHLPLTCLFLLSWNPCTSLWGREQSLPKPQACTWNFNKVNYYFALSAQRQKCCFCTNQGLTCKLSIKSFPVIKLFSSQKSTIFIAYGLPSQ